MTGTTKSGTFSPEAKRDADAFFEHKKKHPGVVAEKDMTPLERRMQSSGPGVPVDHGEQGDGK